MRNHSHRSMKRLKGDGGSAAPSPGRMPRGAKKREMNPASSSIPSDWYDEKSSSAATHDRKSSVQRAAVARGQTFATSRSEATIPAATTRVSAASPEPSQRRVGAYQARSTG